MPDRWPSRTTLPLQRDIYIDVERNAAKAVRVHSGLKPVLERRADLTNVMGHRVDSAKYYYWVTEKIFRDHLLTVKEGRCPDHHRPLFQFEAGYDLGDRTLYSDTNRYYCNTGGVMLTATSVTRSPSRPCSTRHRRWCHSTCTTTFTSRVRCLVRAV
ncbi:MAG: hypothetical protein IPO05_17590 [Flavobacteriales bacterium]|nr:hypothetical protein [Flavobacteriales bacterium]